MAANPRLIALQTAVPPYPVDQGEASRRAALLFESHPEVLRLLSVFDNTGIETRYSCVPIDWYTEPHGWKERTDLYLANSVDLLEQLTLACLAEAGMDRNDIDAVVVASTTGIATPSLDALLIERMGLRRDIMRLPIFGFGCAGGVFGLARAADLARATPGARVLFLVVELCALTFRKDDVSKSNIVAAALFGDGAAGAIITGSGNGAVLGATGSHTWPNSLDIMGWEVEEDGLKARFAQSIPSLVASDFRTVANEFLKKNDIPLSGIEAFACHPGGAKVLDALEDALGLPRGALDDSRATLRDYGNMSAATALFVLHRMRTRGLARRTLMSALGPGFSAAFLMLESK
jgi:alkylresorcinol/alkylpyrone synthase